MKNLIPYFIQQHYQQQNFAGSLYACSMFVDISGFTQTTEALIRSGQAEGVEVLSEILRFYFTPTVQSVYMHGGWVANFAGDAFTALFPIRRPRPSVARRALAAAYEINRFFTDHPVYSSKFGDFEFGVKVGLDIGEVEWGIVGSDQQKTYYFRGDAIDGCAHAEHQAEKGDILATKTFFSLIQDLIEGKTENNEYVRIDAIKAAMFPQPRRFNRWQIDSDILRFFYGEDMAQYEQAEFRKIVSVFMAFDHVADLNGFISNILQKLQIYGGTISHLDFGDKGGNLLFFFGAPILYENTPKRALQFILSIKNTLTATIKLRAGITTGISYCGFNGSELRSEFTCLGNAVNQSARFMLKAEWGQILVDHELARESGFHFEYVGDILYKGRSTPIPTYLLLGERTRQECIFTGQMVGRETELQHLLDFARPLRHGKLAGAALIYGEAGLGKSRLAYALHQALVDYATVYTAQTDHIHRQAFNPFIYWLKHYFHQSSDADSTENKARFEHRLAQLIRHLSETSAQSASSSEVRQQLAAELQRTHSFLGGLLGHHWADSLYDQLRDPRLRYENTMNAIKNMLLAESCLHPVMFILEDSHWLDDASCSVLTALSREIKDLPLLLVMTSRYADDGSRPPSPLTPDMPTCTIDLKVLPPASTAQFARDMLGGVVRNSLLNLLENKTQGNPFFVQQLIFYFREHDLLIQDSDGIWALRATVFDLPTNIAAILIARIDRLTKTLKEVVQTAAVLGREFEVHILSHMLRTNLLPTIQQGETEQIWSILYDLHCVFKHILLRDAAYNMQLRARLRRLHRLAATSYETLYSKDLGPYYAKLMYHYGQAHDQERERMYALLTGKQASAKGNQHEAITCLSRALELTPHSEQYDLLLLREEAYHLQGDRQNQAADLRTLAKLVGLHVDTFMPVTHTQDKVVEQTEVALRRARYCNEISEYRSTIPAAQTALHLAKISENEVQEVQARYWWGESLVRQGTFSDARACLKEALNLAQTYAQRDISARILKELGWIDFREGKAEHAQQHLEKALRVARSIGNRQEEMLILKGLGGAANAQGDYVTAGARQQEALVIAREIGHRKEIGSLLNCLGNTCRFQGDYTAAIDYYQKGVRLMHATGWRMGEAIGLINLGLVLPYLGQHETALARAQEGMSLARQVGARMVEGFSFFIAGGALFEMQSWNDAIRAYQKAIEIFQTLHLPHYVAESRAGVARVNLAQRNFVQAQSAVAAILDYWDNGGNVRSVEEPLRVYLTCYQVLHATGNHRAKAVLNDAYEILQDLSARIPDHATLGIFLNVPYHREIMTLWETINRR